MQNALDECHWLPSRRNEGHRALVPEDHGKPRQVPAIHVGVAGPLADELDQGSADPRCIHPNQRLPRSGNRNGDPLNASTLESLPVQADSPHGCRNGLAHGLHRLGSRIHIINSVHRDRRQTALARCSEHDSRIAAALLQCVAGRMSRRDHLPPRMESARNSAVPRRTLLLQPDDTGWHPVVVARRKCRSARSDPEPVTAGSRKRRAGAGRSREIRRDGKNLPQPVKADVRRTLMHALLPVGARLDPG